MQFLSRQIPQILSQMANRAMDICIRRGTPLHNWPNGRGGEKATSNEVIINAFSILYLNPVTGQIPCMRENRHKTLIP
jgi:hypothetical protein